MSDKITKGEANLSGSSSGRNTGRDQLTVSRRSLLKTVGVGLGVAAFGMNVPSVTADNHDQWSIVAIPDTQKYTERSAFVPYLNDQTDWIASNVDSENIVFVSHVGDLVENGDETVEWDRIDEAMATLDGDLDANPDGLVPYATVPGNHDWATTWDRSSSIENYLSYFGKDRYDGRSWYGGTGPGDDDTNSYQLFSAGGYDFLHLALEWEPPGEVSDPQTSLGWGQSILDQYPDRPTILTTHSYLRDDRETWNDVLQEGRRTDDEDNPDGNTAETVWEELVSQNSQIFMVLCGHWHEDDGEYHQVSTNAFGQSVYEILTNYQDLDNGGNGWLRQMEFIKGGGSDSDAPDRIQARTYSPSLDQSMTDDDSTFAIDLDFDARFTELTTDSSFQQGVDGYSGTVDTNLREATPTTSYGSEPVVTVDTKQPQDSENDSQALLRFDGIVGSESGQIPLGSTIETATLTLNTTDDGSGGAFHRMLTDWEDTDTWESFGGGIDADDNEALSTADVEVANVDEGTTTIDVAPTVQAWANGDANFGWAVLPLGGDGWDFETAEGGTPPRLTVNYQPPDGDSGVGIEGDADGDGDVDQDDLDLVQRDIANEDVELDRRAADVNDDGDVDIGDAMSIREQIEGGE